MRLRALLSLARLAIRFGVTPIKLSAHVRLDYVELAQ